MRSLPGWVGMGQGGAERLKAVPTPYQAQMWTHLEEKLGN